MLKRKLLKKEKLKTFFDRIVAQQPDSIIKYADMVTRRSMANDSLFKFTANWIGVKYKEPSFMGADAVYVVGCPVDGCHNVKGSQRAARRVLAVKKALSELDVEAERIEMFHLERGFHPEFVSVAQEMDKKIQKLGPSPLKGESE